MYRPCPAWFLDAVSLVILSPNVDCWPAFILVSYSRVRIRQKQRMDMFWLAEAAVLRLNPLGRAVVTVKVRHATKSWMIQQMYKFTLPASHLHPHLLKFEVHQSHKPTYCYNCQLHFQFNRPHLQHTHSSLLRNQILKYFAKMTSETSVCILYLAKPHRIPALAKSVQSISDSYELVDEILPPPDLTCPHGLSSANFFSHVASCKCAKRSENGILSAYLDYLDNPTLDAEKDYLYTKNILEGSRIADAIVDGFRLKDDDNHYASRFTLKRMHSWKSENSLKTRAVSLWRRITSKYLGVDEARDEFMRYP